MPQLILTEYQSAGSDRSGAGLSVLKQPPLAQQVLTIGAGVQASNPFHPKTDAVSLAVDVACRVAIGGNPDPAGAGFPMSANSEKTFMVPAGLKLAVIEGLPTTVTPLFTAFPVLAAAAVGAPVTWTAAAASNSSAITYSLIDAAGNQLATASGAYTPADSGARLTLRTRSVGPSGAEALAFSNQVVVGRAPAVVPVAPVVTVAPVLSAISPGGAVSFTAGTVTGSPTPARTYNLMKGAELIASGLESGDQVPGAMVGMTLSIELNAVNAAGRTKASSNAVIVAAGVPVPQNNVFAASNFNVYPRLLDKNNGSGRGRYGRWPIRPTGGPKALRLSWTNAVITSGTPGEVLNTVPLTVVQMAIERVSTSTAYVWEFSPGQRGGVIPAGAVDVQSMDLPASIIGMATWPDEDFNIKIIHTVPTIDDNFPGSRYAYEKNIAGAGAQREWTFNPDLATPRATEVFGAPALAVANGSGFNQGQPAARGVCPIVLGVYDDASNLKVICWTGDSISQESTNGIAAFPRIISDALKVGMIQFGISSASSLQLNDANPYHRAYYKYTRQLIDEMGTNERSAGAMAAMLADWNGWKAATGRDAVYRTFITPRAECKNRAISAATFANGKCTIKVPTALGAPPVGAVLHVSGIVPAEYNGAAIASPYGGNAVTVTDSSWNATDGATISYLPVGTAPTGDATSVASAAYNSSYYVPAEANFPADAGIVNTIVIYNQYIADKLADGTIKGIFPWNSLRASTDRSTNEFMKWKGTFAGAPALTLTNDSLHPWHTAQKYACDTEFTPWVAALPST